MDRSDRHDRYLLLYFTMTTITLYCLLQHPFYRQNNNKHFNNELHKEVHWGLILLWPERKWILPLGNLPWIYFKMSFLRKSKEERGGGGDVCCTIASFSCLQLLYLSEIFNCLGRRVNSHEIWHYRVWLGLRYSHTSASISEESIVHYRYSNLKFLALLKSTRCSWIAFECIRLLESGWWWSGRLMDTQLPPIYLWCKPLFLL